jgi:hypothetical protein
VSPPAFPAGRYAFLSPWPIAGGIVAADAHCQSDATANALPGTYRALLATSTQSAVQHAGSLAGSWRRPDGLVVTFNGLDARPLDAAVMQLANKTIINNNFLWFGVDSPTSLGALATTCSDWTSTSGTMTSLQSSDVMLLTDPSYSPPCKRRVLLAVRTTVNLERARDPDGADGAS